MPPYGVLWLCIAKKHISACGGDDVDDREYDPASVTVIFMMMLIIFK